MADIEELMKQRQEKEQKAIEYGIKVRPEKFSYNYTIKEARELADGVTDVKLAGRIMSKRKMGKITFMDLQNLEGHIQLVIKKDDLGEENYKKMHEILDIGDFIGVKGDIFTTQAGEKSIQVYEYTFLGKAYRPLPEKFHSITNQEQIYRERHLDLIMNEETRKRFILRSKFVKLLRNYLDNHGFLEVDTPALQNTASGATAKPFIAHHNALDIDVFLRISPELTLKKLIVGGFTNVYEVARDFRNEGMDPNHLQDFTMVEGYSAYWNYEDNMKFLKDMVVNIISELYDGNLKVKIGEKEIDFSGEWEVVSFRDLILRDCGIDIDKFETSEKLLSEIRSKNIKLEAENLETLGRGNLIDQLYKKVSRPALIKPTYLIKHPTDLSPLARSNDDNPEISDRFQLVVNGQEIINGYSELVDARVQEKRLLEQSELKANGDEEAMSIDYEYIKTMEYGMPPISGWGLGVDRFMQFLTNSTNIRDVVLYPLMKPIEADAKKGKNVSSSQTECEKLNSGNQTAKNSSSMLDNSKVNNNSDEAERSNYNLENEKNNRESLKTENSSIENTESTTQTTENINNSKSEIENNSSTINNNSSFSKKEINFTRDEALKLLKKYNKEDFHIRHAITVEEVMRYFAKVNNEDEDFWGLVGLLHDVDYEMYPNEHCKKALDILKEINASDDLIHAICSHAYGICSNVEPVHIMEKILFAIDELTGLIWAAAKMRPSQSTKDMELKSLKKKYKDKKFAAGCSRDTIAKGAEMLGMELDELLEKTLTAMQEREDEIQRKLN